MSERALILVIGLRQSKIDDWLTYYNEVRLHSALQRMTPAGFARQARKPASPDNSTKPEISTSDGANSSSESARPKHAASSGNWDDRLGGGVVIKYQMSVRGCGSLGIDRPVRLTRQSFYH